MFTNSRCCFEVKRSKGKVHYNKASHQGQRGPRMSSGRQEFKQHTNLFTCVSDCMQYAGLWTKHCLYYFDREQQKQCFLIKTTNTLVYTYSLLGVFISQYSIKSRFYLDGRILNDGGKCGPVPNLGQDPLGQRPLAFPCSRHCITISQGFDAHDMCRLWWSSYLLRTLIAIFLALAVRTS